MTRYASRLQAWPWLARCLNCHIGVRRGCVCLECLRAALVPIVLAEAIRFLFRHFGG